MKTLFILTAPTLFLACNSSISEEHLNLQDSFTTVTEKDSSSHIVKTEVTVKDSTYAFAQQILAGTAKPTDNQLTFNCLDSLTSSNAETRTFYFSVFKKIARQSDGALSEAISGYIKSYFQLYPFEFLKHYKLLSPAEKTSMIDFISYEFYASGEEYKADLEEYFTAINRACTRCQESDKQELRLLKAEIIKGVEEQLD